MDGKKSDVVADAYIVPKTHDNDLWRVHGLKPGEHTLRLVMRDDADARSKGKQLTHQPRDCVSGEVAGKAGRRRTRSKSTRASMKTKPIPTHLCPWPTALIAAGFLLAYASFSQAAPRTLSREVLRDKIRGAWAGQMIGVAYGAPTEFKFLGKIIEGDIKGFPLTNAIGQDDLYVEMTFARVMDTVGLDATTADYGEAFKNSQYDLWHANAAARRNLRRGIPASVSGHPRYNLHADDIDFQIEADFIGIMCPGLPQVSNQYCERVGRVMNYGDGLYGGIFVCGMYSAAYFENDPRTVVKAGLACIPAESAYAKLMIDLLAWSAQEPNDWRKVWRQVQEKWDKNDPCPNGAFRAYNIDAKLNAPTSRSACSLAKVTGSRRWRSRRAAVRTPTAIPPVRSACSAR